jgi:hypothetical protein
MFERLAATIFNAYKVRANLVDCFKILRKSISAVSPRRYATSSGESALRFYQVEADHFAQCLQDAVAVDRH